MNATRTTTREALNIGKRVIIATYPPESLRTEEGIDKAMRLRSASMEERCRIAEEYFRGILDEPDICELEIPAAVAEGYLMLNDRVRLVAFYDVNSDCVIARMDLAWLDRDRE